MTNDLNLFFDLSVDMLCIASSDGYLKQVNPAFEKTLGWTSEELLNQPFFNFLHPDDIESTKNEFQKLAAGSPSISIDKRIRCRDGSYKYLSWTASPDPQNTLFYSVLRDNTERRKTEEFFRLAIEASPSGVIIVDSHGKITLANSQTENYFGYSRHELLTQSVDMLVPGSSGINHAVLRAGFFNHPTARGMGAGRDLYGLRKNGEKFPVEIGLNPIEIQGSLFVLAVIVDITERKRIEETLQVAMQEAKRANQLKSEFLNLMSHELRTPLTVILGNIPLLTNENELPANSEIAEIAHDMEDSGKHLLALINDLLDISKIEAGKLQLHPEPINVKDLLHNVASNIKILADKKGLTLEMESADSEINADLVRMKQILLNLLSNAVKFTEKGGILLKASVSENKINFEVKDTGCGIRKEDLSQLFKVFNQLDDSKTRKATGTGLGLVITKKLIEMHGGEITVESKPNQGSTFKFFIPK
ncbi:MAG: PAS domain S-box protein [Calditrichaeota bacterium]|nr:MAG: PAS domain S-box protein [Calditrichota bacterium]